MSGCERGCMEVVCRIMGVHGNAYEWLDNHDLAFWRDCEGIDVEVLRLLVSKGLDMNAVNRYNRKTALHIACKMNKVELVKSLIAVRINMNILDDSGHIPLHIACDYGYTEIVQLLIENGANMNILDEFYGSIPLSIACEGSHTEVVQLLVDGGAKINIRDKQGESPIFKACKKGHTEITQLLVDGGARVNVMDKNKSTLLIICFKYQKLHLLPILRQAYIQQHLLIPPQLISFPNTNSFSRKKINSSRLLGHTLHHSLSRRQIRGYMDKRGLVLNGMRELVARFPDNLSLEEDEGRTCGYRVEVERRNLNDECCEALLFWESEGGYALRDSYF